MIALSRTAFGRESEMSTAFLTLSEPGARVVRTLLPSFRDARVFLHTSVASDIPGATRFERIAEAAGQVFPLVTGLVFVAPTGVVVRAIAPLIEHKLSDPAVVVVDVGARYAISLLSGHEGGANALAVQVANILGAEPVLTTTSEAVKNLIVGIGCRRNAPASTIVEAVRQALSRVDVPLESVRFLASIDLKRDEVGLLEAATQLGVPLRFIASQDIRACCLDFEHSDFVEEKVAVPAVAEPVALLAGRRTELLLPKTIINSVTVAIARENCSSLE
jgi:cobalt-precorrin 5A hydrolase